MSRVENSQSGIGYLATDIELRQTNNGTSVANCRVAVPGFRKDDPSEFFSLVLWGQTAEFAEKYAKKGNLVAFEGETRTRSWENGEGEKRYATEVRVNSFKILERKQQTEEDDDI